jgi:hypothetical protein
MTYVLAYTSTCCIWETKALLPEDGTGPIDVPIGPVIIRLARYGCTRFTVVTVTDDGYCAE